MVAQDRVDRCSLSRYNLYATTRWRSKILHVDDSTRQVEEIIVGIGCSVAWYLTASKPEVQSSRQRHDVVRVDVEIQVRVAVRTPCK